ncbi:GDA1/CD39 (nucleoside phosphatase) family protein [Toxoplasma gondii RUB]|uniref:GDA1/CD39 (Nucleoside phosphatase) family protein n=1 Tax=Toxoplasma gondii RUB TaxID=935652 RepID=A0A086LPE6_TOXGO|nr:GDA1/CD39 (nucleoside phosphatase) family protein [Toxoplasma gondii RUB]
MEGFNGFVCMCAFLVVCFPLARNAGHSRPVHWGPKRTIQEGRQELHRLKSLDTECRHATQAVVVVDAGSSSTRPILFRMRMVSCPLSQLRVIPESIRHVANGIRRTGLREVLENWQERSCRRQVPSPRFWGTAWASWMEAHLSEEEKVQVKALGMPFTFYSTAGVHDFQDWYRDRFCLALRQSINNNTNKFHYKLLTSSELTRAITGAEEAFFAFFAVNHLTGRLTHSGHTHHEEAEQPDVLPSSVKAVNLQRERFLPKRYPSADVISVSFMHLGVDSSTGLFLKQLCSDEEFLIDGVCSWPMMINLLNLEMKKLLSTDRDICQFMAVSARLLQLMEEAEGHPASIKGEKSVRDENGQHVADLGWPLGAVLQQVLDAETWGHMVFESDWIHNVGCDWLLSGFHSRSNSWAH